MIDRLFHFVRQIQLFSLYLLAPGGEDLLAKRLVVILAIRISSRRRHAFPSCGISGGIFTGGLFRLLKSAL